MNKKTQDLLVTLFPIVLMIIASVLYFVSPLALAWFLGALIVGPIIYFAMGRKPAPATPPAPTTSSGDVIARVIGELYGARS